MPSVIAMMTVNLNKAMWSSEFIVTHPLTRNHQQYILTVLLQLFM